MSADIMSRAGTAVGVVLVTTVAIYAGQWTCFALFYLIMLACLWELSNLLLPVEMRHTRRKLGLLLMGSLPYGMSMYAAVGNPIAWGQVVVVLSGLFFLWMILEVWQHDGKVMYGILLLAVGLLYVVLPLSMVPMLTTYKGGYDYSLLLGLIVLIWVFDTTAYLVGSAIGRHKIIPAVSPGKSWEGWIGGAICCVLVAWILSALVDNYAATTWFVLAAVVAVFGFAGDLSESLLKRNFVVKDSGTLLPGHGGFLDRFDSLLPSLVFVSLYIFMTT